ncbi:hypothetical protein GIB67_034484 [Kingdonia uniflora]|uniref:HVA22-like protein n=1 Tax=Kingdonia uniflora TaxID=39325 RepID=A0A7J7PBG6_9MAGN|nr:hypothetical protein GIB67_034484 [Kingdonia uniflora]
MVFAHNRWAYIQAIEGNSNGDNRKWLTFWVLFAMTMLFEYTYELLNKWIQFWLEMKLVVTFCLVAPRLNGDVYVYETFIRPCFHVNPQLAVLGSISLKRLFFLVVQMISYLWLIDMLKLKRMDLKYWISSSSKRGKKHRKKQEELKAEKMAAINKVSFLPNEIGDSKATTAKCNAAPGSSVLEKFLKEWSCDICQVKTSSNENLRDHLREKKYKKKQEEIKANKMATKNKGISKKNDT